MNQPQNASEIEYPRYTQDDFQFQDPAYCDLVMKGGIASGVVYPLAICELAKKYQFKSIGGTSAGAIAAAAAAAAEYGRQHKQGSGFVGMSEVPSFLEKNLLSLFQATPNTEPLFQFFLKLLSAESQQSQIIQIFTTVLSHFKIWFTIGALPGLIVLILIVYNFVWPVGLFGSVCAFFLALIGGLAGVTIRLIVLLFGEVVQNGYGICPGKTQRQRKNKCQQPALSNWLSQLLDDLAGLGEQESGIYHPLTFGDLWGSSSEAMEDKSCRQINLEMMTTNLTHGEPLQLPSARRTLYFYPEDFKKIFPDHIVEWMVKNSPKQCPPDRLLDRKLTLYQMPEAKDWPIVVTTRMSLSFPILLTAIPLYSINYTYKDPAKQVAEKCWFSDGGICSNFPIHFFDSLWPQWPTFAISLDPENPESTQNVWLPTKQNQGIQPSWTVIQNLTQFFGAIFSTAQNWRDTTQARLPGYRDRIVHINLNSTEGGLNLKMPISIIRKLAIRGQQAGQVLIQDFNWETHRWIRFLSSTAEVESQQEIMRNSYEQGLGSQSLKEFLQTYPESKQCQSYKVNPDWLYKARNLTDQLMDAQQPWFKKVFKEQKNIPNPKSELRITPRL